MPPSVPSSATSAASRSTSSNPKPSRSSASSLSTPTRWSKGSDPAWLTGWAWATTKSGQSTPRAVYCSVSGYGQTGPYSQMAGHDINYISFAGALGLIGRLAQRQARDSAEPDRRLRRRRPLRRSWHPRCPDGPRENGPRPVRRHRHDRRRAVHAVRKAIADAFFAGLHSHAGQDSTETADRPTTTSIAPPMTGTSP